MDFTETLIAAGIAFRPVIGLLVIGLIVTLCFRGKEAPADAEEDYWFWAIK